MLNSAQQTVNTALSPGPLKKLILTVFSAIAAAGLVILLFVLLNYDRISGSSWLHLLPFSNVTFNLASTSLLLYGLYAIKKGRYTQHMKLMLSAFICSAFFLFGYLIHINFSGDTPFAGEGLIRPVYFFILISHISLSAFVVPLVLGSFYFVLKGNFVRHRKLSRITYPVWLYVSFTGVIIFLMLRILY